MYGRRRSRNVQNEPGPLKSTPTKGTVENHWNSLGFQSAPTGLLETRTGRWELRHWNLTINGRSLKKLGKTSFSYIAATTPLVFPIRSVPTTAAETLEKQAFLALRLPFQEKTNCFFIDGAFTNLISRHATCEINLTSLADSPS